MNIVAFILSLIAAVISFFQSADIIRLSGIMKGLSELGGNSSQASAFTDMSGAGALVMLASCIGLAGGILALLNKKTSSSISLFISAAMCGLAAIVAGNGFNDFAIYGIVYAVACICVMAGSSNAMNNTIKTIYISDEPIHDESKDIPGPVSLAKSNITTEEQTHTKNPPELNSSNELIIASPTLDSVPPKAQQVKQYEPVLGIETDALIKRAFLFLEDAEFDNAGRCLNQALNQDPEDARIHFAQLMLIHKVHNAEELIQNLATPLDNEKLFQRALRFADDDYKTQLEGYAQQSNDKLEKQRLANEAEQQRIRAEYEAEQERIKAEHEAEQKRLQAEKEAEQEKLYQEILNLKETASTIPEFDNLLELINSLKPYKDTDELFKELSQARTEKIYQEILNLKSTASNIPDFNSLLTLINSIKPYKDTDELYNEVSQIRKKEEKYESALWNKTRAKNPEDLKQVITKLEELDGYKDSEKLLAEAKADLIKAEKAQLWKWLYTKILLTIIGIGLIIGAHFFWELYKKRVENANQAFAAAQSFESQKLYNNALSKYREAKELGHSDAQKHITALETKIAKEKQEQARLAKEREEAQRRERERQEQERKAREDALKRERERKNISDKANNTFQLARSYETAKLFDDALSMYREAVKLGHPDAQRYLDALESKLAQSKTQTNNTVFNVTKEVLADYSQAETFLNDKNYSQALNIFRRLANLGYAPAQDKLAWMYQNGWGVQQNYSIAVDWFRKAANQGNTEAMASMGLMYYRGWGVTRDYNTALEWYTKAANQGSEVAQRRINSIQLLMFNKEIISSVERRNDFPISGAIAANSLSVREYANTKATVLKTLKTGHPISISRALESDNDYWFYIRTASGTEGWVLAAYVNLNNNRGLSYNENSNRRYSLPQQGYISTASSSDHLNLRNIPAIQGSHVIEKIDNGAYITAYEIFAGDTIDWYRVRTNSGNIGWVSGKYIVLR